MANIKAQYLRDGEGAGSPWWGVGEKIYRPSHERSAFILELLTASNNFAADGSPSH